MVVTVVHESNTAEAEALLHRFALLQASAGAALVHACIM